MVTLKTIKKNETINTIMQHKEIFSDQEKNILDLNIYFNTEILNIVTGSIPDSKLSTLSVAPLLQPGDIS